MLSTSKRVIPKDIIYIGNNLDLPMPVNELIEKDKGMLLGCNWKDAEDILISKYLMFNIIN